MSGVCGATPSFAALGGVPGDIIVVHALALPTAYIEGVGRTEGRESDRPSECQMEVWDEVADGTGETERYGEGDTETQAESGVYGGTGRWIGSSKACSLPERGRPFSCFSTDNGAGAGGVASGGTSRPSCCFRYSLRLHAHVCEKGSSWVDTESSLFFLPPAASATAARSPTGKDDAPTDIDDDGRERG